MCISGFNQSRLLLSRDGAEWFFVKTNEKKVPVLIFSAGIAGMDEITDHYFCGQEKLLAV